MGGKTRKRRMGGKTRKRILRNHRGGDAKKPLPICQCIDVATGAGCQRVAQEESLFCEDHQDCPKPPLSGHEPEYNPERWNDDTAITKSHNCYNYFANYINAKSVQDCKNKNLKGCREYFAQPGALHGDRDSLNAIKRRVCPVLESLIMKDIPGLKKTTFYERCPAGTSKGAMVNDEFVDFHFFLQHAHKDPKKDGLWSHKDGSNKAKDFDALGRPIFNPELAIRDYNWQGSNLNYDRFCGFYCVPRDKEVVLGQGGFSLTPQERRKLRALKEEARKAGEIRRILLERKKQSALKEE